MPSNNSLLILLLLSTGALIPVLYIALRRLNAWPAQTEFVSSLHYWAYFLLSILGLRLVVGVLMLVTGAEIFGIAKFYPIRIAYPNYDLLAGLPYVLICLAVLLWLPNIIAHIIGSRWSYFLIWLFAVVFLLSFGGIHGGLVVGNTGIANSAEHIADASLNETVRNIFETHADRVAGLTKPSYLAAHSTSHPAGSIAYWQMLTKITPFTFSVVNVLLFALGFPIMYWALRRRFGGSSALHVVMACMFIPAILIYGRSDDAVYYMVAAVIVSLLSVALHESRYGLTIWASGLLIGAMNLSYASVVLLPAALSFSTDAHLTQVWRYVRRVAPHVLIILLVVYAGLTLEAWVTSYEWLEAFGASVHYNQGSTIISMLMGGHYARGLNDRVMAVYDFIIFAGPLFLYLFVWLIRNRGRSVGSWKIKNIALFILLCALVIKSLGPGEVARPWGSLFMIIGFFWLADLLNQVSEKTRLLLIRAQLAWALILQTALNFGW